MVLAWRLLPSYLRTLMPAAADIESDEDGGEDDEDMDADDE